MNNPSEEQKQKGQFTLDGKILSEEKEEPEPQVDITTYLDFYGLKEDPTKGRDFVHTDLVDRMLGLIKAGRSIRLLGEAGIGKSATTRDLKTKLENDGNAKYIVATVGLHSLVDPNNRFITKGGLAALTLFVLDEFDSYFGKHKKKSIPHTEEHVKALRSVSDTIDAPIRTYHLTKFFEKTTKAGYRVVIVLDDADALQNFENFDNLNYLVDRVHSAIICYKTAEERAARQRAIKKEDGEFHEETRARKQRQDAFWRRSFEITIPGQPADVVLQIMRGKLSKKEDLLTKEAQAYALMAAYSGRAPSADRMDAYVAGLRPKQLLYNPGRIGAYLANCLEIGYRRQAKNIDADIGEVACRKTIANLDAYGAVDRPSLQEHAEELKLAKEKLASKRK